MSDKCKTCDGCGYVSKITGVPWNLLVGSDMDQTECEINGQTHKQARCHQCNGIGVKALETKDQ